MYVYFLLIFFLCHNDTEHLIILVQDYQSCNYARNPSTSSEKEYY